MLTNRVTLLVFILAVISCDSLTEEDEIKREKQVSLTQSVYYILPGSSTIIDLESIIKESFLNATLSVSGNPQRGTLSELSPFLLKYRPSRAFQEGEDHFDLSLMNGGKILAKKTLTIKMEKNKEDFPCTLIAVEDKIKLNTGSSSVSIGILENDWLCDIDKSTLQISIIAQPKYGQAIIENESIVYTPAAEYRDNDELIYGVTASADGSTSYGLLSFGDRWEITSQKKIIGSELRAISFPDENTGFLATDAGLYKTTDGGSNWKVMVSEGLYSDIFFFDAQNGFAAYEDGGFMTTKDGGRKWKPSARFNDIVISVVFTSATTGFIGVYDGEDYATVEVLKTEDGGETWKKVLAYTASGWGYVNLQFINDTTGYAILSEKIFVTNDAGETWDVLLDGSVNHFYAIEKNKFFTLSADDQTSIITSQDANEWRPVAYFPFGILSIGFSPSADVGLALVWDTPQNDDSSPNFRSRSIVRTIDRGETWVKEPMDGELHGPFGMSIPSNDVAYFLCYDRIIKYTNK